MGEDHLLARAVLSTGFSIGITPITVFLMALESVKYAIKVVAHMSYIALRLRISMHQLK